MNVVQAGERLSAIGVVAHATPVVKLLIFLLLASMVAALIVCARKLMSGEKLSGGSAFLSGLRLGGPITGLLGATWTAFGMALALANVTGPAPINVLAHGWAEILLLAVLGFLAGSIAVIANWAVESRIDRSILKA